MAHGKVKGDAGLLSYQSHMISEHGTISEQYDEYCSIFVVVVVTEAEGVCRCQEDVFGEKVYMFATKVIPAQEREIGSKKSGGQKQSHKKSIYAYICHHSYFSGTFAKVICHLASALPTVLVCFVLKKTKKNCAGLLVKLACLQQGRGPSRHRCFSSSVNQYAQKFFFLFFISEDFTKDGSFTHLLGYGKKEPICFNGLR